MKKKRFLVIGLGILGQSVARTLAEDGAEVVAIDSDSHYVDQIKDHVALAVTGDSTDPKLLEQLGCQHIDAAVVCIGENFAGAVLTTAHLLDLKVAHVAVRATNALNASIFKRLGAHEVFFVESQMGQFLAHKLQRPWILNEMSLGAGFSIVEWAAPQWMLGKKLSDIALPKNFSVQVIALRDREQSQNMIMPNRDSVVQAGYQLLLSGRNEDLAKLHLKQDEG